MIRITVLYPNTRGSRFDLDYYVKKHCPMVLERMGESCKGFGVDQGVAGVLPPGVPAFRVTAWFLFDSIEAFDANFGTHADAIMADIPNYTDLQPIIQMGETRA